MRVTLDRDAWSGVTSRGKAAAFTCAVHALALAIYLIPLSVAGPPAKAPKLVAFDSPVPGPPQPAKPKPRQPKKVRPQPLVAEKVPPPILEIPIVTAQVVALLEQADAQADSGGCDLTPAVQAALRSNAAVQDELLTIPVERRSVANAIAIWNQAWVEPDGQIKAEALDTIRVAVAATVSAGSEECRLQQQVGPRLIYLPGARHASGDTTVLALGSGNWTWQQIADTAQPPDPLAQLASIGPQDGPGVPQPGPVNLFNDLFSR